MVEIMLNSTQTLNLAQKHAIQGSMTGEVVYIITSLVPMPSLDQNPFLNRAIDTGVFNIFQDQLWSRLPLDYNKTTDNELYLGLLQTIKYLSGNEGANYALNHMLQHKPTTPAEHAIVTAARMTALYTTGKLESKIVSEPAKWFYVGTTYAGFAGYYYFSDMETEASKTTGAITLSPGGFMETTAGLCASFIIPHALHYVGIDINKEFELNKTLALKTSILGSALILSSGNPLAAVPAGAIIVVGSGVFDDAFAYAESEKVHGFAIANIATVLFLTSATAYHNGYNNAKTGGFKILAGAFASAAGAISAEVLYMLMEGVADTLQPVAEYTKEATITGVCSLSDMFADMKILCDYFTTA
jgi:hypothetical protein